jgi:thiamine-phosphate pyrophosphorylase
MKTIARFHYLTQDLPGISHRQLTQIACENGIRWIQLRVKNKSFDEWLQIAFDVKEICEKYTAVLIVNDNVEIAKRVNADGVHLGKNDLPVAEARKILGKKKIIGGSANSFNDIKLNFENGVDYSGIGPFRFTQTKENLSPVLGLEQIKIIRQQCVNENILLPLIAIGGIRLNDVDDLLNTGIYGIAVSSAINLSDNKSFTIKSFLNKINSNNYSGMTINSAETKNYQLK